jgi:hypothetical protein
VPFTPWTTAAGYLDLLQTMNDLNLQESVPPIQLGIRLLIPAGSRLLELDDIREICGDLDAVALVHPWKHCDGRMDDLAEEIQQIAASSEKRRESRRGTFERIWNAARAALGADNSPVPVHAPILADRATVPYLNEPWYC